MPSARLVGHTFFPPDFNPENPFRGKFEILEADHPLNKYEKFKIFRRRRSRC
jgi:hypothetical protein